MQEAERIRRIAFQCFPGVARGFQQRQRAHDVGLHEGARAVDRAVDVALGGEVDHRVGPVLGQQAVDQVAVADVALDENMRRVVLQRRKRIEVARVREGVEVDHADAAGDRLEHEIAADEAGSAGYKRSEEHTSELQSLMRISYAVFCLKKTNKTHTRYKSK